jgi:hypothetical protein
MCILSASRSIRVGGSGGLLFFLNQMTRQYDMQPKTFGETCDECDAGKKIAGEKIDRQAG